LWEAKLTDHGLKIVLQIQRYWLIFYERKIPLPVDGWCERRTLLVVASRI
jgi:hypothetical protein